MSNDDFKPRLGRIRDDGRAKGIRHSTRVIGEAVRNAGNVTRAARDIDVSRPTLHDLMRKHGLDAARYRHPDLPGGEDEGDEPEGGA